MGRALLGLAWSMCIVFAFACSDDLRSSACIPGLQIACPCLGGGDGVQRCSSDGTFGKCVCESEADGGSRSEKLDSGQVESESGTHIQTTRGLDAASSEDNPRSRADASVIPESAADAGEPAAGAGGRTGETAAGPTTPQVATMMLSSGPGKLIAAFPSKPGIVVVLASKVLLLARDGSELGTWEAPRMVTAAAMDGDWLGVADGAVVTGFDVLRALEQVTSTALVEPCSDAVVVSRQRFVCGPNNDTSRAYRTYDLKSGTVLGVGGTYIYKGYPMRRVPGADQFVTVSNGSPSDFNLFTVNDNHQVIYLGESPYHGDLAVSSIFAFDADSAAHLITHEGLLLDFSQPECGAMPSSQLNAVSTGCFIKNGALGTLMDGQSFVAMTNANGMLYGLVDRGLMPAPSTMARAFWLQSVAVAQRAVMRQVAYRLEAHEITSFAFDAVSSRVVLGTWELTSVQTPATFRYHVMLLALEQST